MAHINYTRNVLYARKGALKDLLPAGNLRASFAAFCGTAEQRRSVGMQGIRRCCGQMGIVILQNDIHLARAVGLLRKEMPELTQSFPRFRTYSVNPAGSRERYYDPLYGLPVSAVLDAIAPIDGSGYGASSSLALRSYLSAYLEILDELFSRDPAPFGRYPYSLNHLYALTEMSFFQLEQQVLQNLSRNTQDRVSPLLSQDNAQQQAFAAVKDFATEMEDFLWSPRNFREHTCMSIVEAVRERCVISISIPTPRPAVLRYLYQELKTLKDAGDEFLLVVAEVPISGSTELRQLFTNPHSTASYATGILAGDLSHVIGMPEEVAPFLSEHQEVLVFSCASTQQAAPFSEAMGTYQRIVTEDHVDHRRLPFHFFADYGYGSGTREVTENNITPQELLYLGKGALLCGSLYIPPVIVERVML